MAMPDADRIIRAVRGHVDAILREGEEVVSDVRIRADAFDPDPMEGVSDNARSVVDDTALTNVAVQQEYPRTLVALGRVTGARRYRRVAADTVRWLFEECCYEAGLPYWGGPPYCARSCCPSRKATDTATSGPARRAVSG